MCHGAFTVMAGLDLCRFFKKIFLGYLGYPTENQLTHTLYLQSISTIILELTAAFLEGFD